MISLKGLCLLFSIPIRLLWTIIKFPFVGGIKEKYANDLHTSIKIEMARAALNVPVQDSGILSFKSVETLLNKDVARSLPNLVQGLNKYGQRFDKQSFWLVEAENRSTDDPILIYLHGGGYYIDVQPPQLESLLAIYHLLEPKAKNKLSILHLDYDLLFKGCQITTQLYQLAETYDKLVQEGNKNILLMGDSAGGHLLITFLQYLKQLDSKTTVWPRSALLISPWVKVRADPSQFTPGHSWYDNWHRDLIPYNVIMGKNKQDAFVGNLDLANMLVSPGNLPYKYSDWDDIPTLSYPGYSTFVILGEHELFKDDVLEWSQYAVKSPLSAKSKNSGGIFNEETQVYKSDAKNNGEKNAYVEVIVEPWGVHDASLLLESDIAYKLGKKNMTVADVNRSECFGVALIVDFLNKVL